MRFDEEDVVRVMFFSIVLLFVVSIVIGIIDVAFIDPIRAENAIDECRMRGFESYDSYRSRPLYDQPYGLKCAQPLTDVRISGAFPVESAGGTR